MTFFISGIDTGVGKTIASALLCKILNASYWKPIQSGSEEDSDLKTVNDLLSGLKSFPEAYSLKAPLSPHRAAELENKTIELDKIKVPEYTGTLIVEGAGGLMVPLNNDSLLVDWVQTMGWPVILMSKNYLGSINHTLLSVELLKNRNIPIAGIIFNGEENKATESAIANFANVPVLGRIEYTEELNPEFIEREAERLKSGVLKYLEGWEKA